MCFVHPKDLSLLFFELFLLLGIEIGGRMGPNSSPHINSVPHSLSTLFLHSLRTTSMPCCWLSECINGGLGVLFFGRGGGVLEIRLKVVGGVYMVVSQNKGAQYRPQNIIVLIMGTPKMVPLILGNPHIRIPLVKMYGNYQMCSGKAGASDLVVKCRREVRLGGLRLFTIFSKRGGVWGTR